MVKQKYGIGSIHINNKNLEYEVIEYESYSKRKIRFLKSGYEMYTTLASMSSKKVLDKSTEFLKYEVGNLFKTKGGLDFKIIEKLNKGFRKIEFLCDHETKIVKSSNIGSGTISHPKKSFEYEVGKKFKTQEGCNFEIIEYLNDRDRKIRFLDKYRHEKTVKTTNILYGTIKNPYFKSVKGAAYIGSGKYKVSINKKQTLCYNKWSNIIIRGFDEKYKIKNPTYKNVTVCKEWLDFQNFGNFFEKTYPKIDNIKFELDKDLLQDNMEYKIYSDSTCVWLPKSINSFLTNKMSTNTSGFIGVSYHKRDKMYLASINKIFTNKVLHLGCFETAEKASCAYKTERAKNAEEAKDYLRSLNYLSEEIIQLIK